MSVTARQHIMEFLRKELVGPDPTPPHVQADGEEVLTTDPPRLRYGAGVLFPQATVADAATDVAAAEVAEIAEPLDLTAGSVPEEGGDSTIFRADDAFEAADQTIALTNAFLPSALGLSCLTEAPSGGLTVSIEAATYRCVTVVETLSNGDTKERKQWWREPLNAEVVLSHADLTGAGLRRGTRPVVRAQGTPARLEVRFLSRPYGDGQEQAGCRLLTISLVNGNGTNGTAPRNEECFFQVAMQIRATEGQPCFVEYPEHGIPLDAEEESLALLYRHQKTYAIGHGCAAEWRETGENHADMVRSEVLPCYEIKPVIPMQITDLNLDMLELSDRGQETQVVPRLSALCDRYETWINAQQALSEELDFPAGHLPAADRHISQCRDCLQRMRRGVTLLEQDARVRQAFRLANRAMLAQQLHYNLGVESPRSWTAQGNLPHPDKRVVWPDLSAPPAGKGAWRPFQIAFILLNLCSLSGPEDPEREIVDLIWFPTGGGKTEAYLGLTAFTILYRRLLNPNNAGTTVLMRYTLRLLTAQQFERAAALICALEIIRQERVSELGEMPISIGLWVGSGVTPNKRADAVTKYNRLRTGQDRDNPFIVLRCPWCGIQMGPVQVGKTPRVMGYSLESNPMTIALRCEDPDCAFSKKKNRTLPLLVVDEDIYDNPPTLLIGTVDKFAMLPWEEKARRLFALGMKGISPPDLIIQDELHLISGPLGSMVGHYETVVQELCTRRHENHVIRPKIVASTATISRAAEQCQALYNCLPENVFQFPPQALRAGDSFFAREDAEQPGRVYVGVHASALPSHVTAQIRVMAALLQGPMHLEQEAERDPYWTLIGYFNSLRELGHAATLVRADIREYLNAVWLRKEIGKPKDGEREWRRFTGSPLELTSRVSSATIPESLQRLMRPYPSSSEEKPVDICLATNMISVGVDVPRLGLMTVIGQPKTTSEYIQATSRVGRSKKGPGLVVVIYNTGKPRDRSHYEHFRSYHSSIYRYVEPTSVTPFAAPVRERALHALIVTLARYLSPPNLSRPQPFPDEDVWARVCQVIEERVTQVDPGEREETMLLLERRKQHWHNVVPPRYGNFGPVIEETPLMYPAGSVPSELWEERAWPVQSSMRDVDATCNANVLTLYPQPMDAHE